MPAPADRLRSLRRFIAAILLLGLGVVLPAHGAAGTIPQATVGAVPNSVAGADTPADAIVVRAWLDDPSGTLTPAQALQQTWVPYEGDFFRGYSSSTTWLRLRIDPQSIGHGTLATDQRLVLRIEPGHLDEVVMFRVGRPGEPFARVGDTVSQPVGGFRWIAHSVVIPNAVEPFEVLLRIRSRGTHIAKVAALRWDTARDLEASALVRATGFVVFSGIVIILAALFWLSRRDGMLVLFASQQCAALAVGVSQMGLLRIWASDRIQQAWIDEFSSVMIPVYTLVVLMFHVKLLRSLGAREPDRTLLPWALLLPVLGLLLMLAGFRQPALALTILTAPLFMPIFMVVAWRCRQEPGTSAAGGERWQRIYQAAAYAAMTVLTLPQSLAILGLRRQGEANFDWFTTYSVISALLMGGLLRLRAAQVERQQRELTRALAEAQRLEQLQSARATEQSELVTMLVHELKTPLSVINLALGGSKVETRIRERALRSVTAMHEVIDRCAQIARLDHPGASGQGETEAQSELLDTAAILDGAIALQPQSQLIDLDAQLPLPACRTDRQMLLMILNNLLDNALKYGAPGTRVSASVQAALREGHAGVAFRVSNAPGRAGRPDAQHLFEKYHRSPHARHQSGSGLGLYLSHRLAARLNGELTLLDGEDVRFELWIPVNRLP